MSQGDLILTIQIVIVLTLASTFFVVGKYQRLMDVLLSEIDRLRKRVSDLEERA